MFTIEWDKQRVKLVTERISSDIPKDMECFDFGTLFSVIVNGIDIAGLSERRNPHLTGLMDLFLSTFSVFRFIDPERLQDKPFHLIYNIDNVVLGEGFRYYVQYDREADLVTFEYIYIGKSSFLSLQIPLKDFAAGVILAAEEMIDEVLGVSETCKDVSYHIFKADLEIIKNWYREVYEEDIGHFYASSSPREKQTPGIVTTDHPGAVQIIWNRRELEDRIRKISAINIRPDIWKGFEMDFHFFIDDIDIIGGAFTFFYPFLFNINWVLRMLDPEHIDLEKLHFSSNDSMVTGTGFNFNVTLLDDHETILIEYSGIFSHVPHKQFYDVAQITTSLKKYAIAAIQGNEEFLWEVKEVWPEVVLTEDYQWMTDEISTLREWYRERYHEELPRLSIIE